MSIKRIANKKEVEENKKKKGLLVDVAVIQKYLLDLENRIKKLEKNSKN